MLENNRIDFFKILVIIHRAPHLFCCRALEVQKVVYALDASHLRHPVNDYRSLVGSASASCTPVNGYKYCIIFVFKRNNRRMPQFD